MNTKRIDVGTRFYYGELHTIKEIDEKRVIHSYTYTDSKGKKIRVRDGFMYRSVFDKLVANNVIIIINN